MTLVAEIDGVALPDGALLITGGNINGINGLPASAYYGEALTGGLQVDDPNGDIELEGLHVLTVDETACTGAERIWTGWVSGRRVGRGPLPYKSGVSRVWDVDIIEANWAFALMVFRASSAKRPAETDLVRMQYIMESAPMAFTPVVDNGRMNYTDNPISFDDSDLVTKYPIEGINEFVGISGKNFYAYWDHAAGELSGHYDLMGVGPTSTLAISNDIADTDSTTFYPFLDAQLTMTGAWTVTGMLLGYRGAYAYGIRQATIDALSPTELSPVEFQRDEVYRTDRIGRLDTANATIVSMLNQRAEDQTSITVSIRVPASQVNLVEAGDILDVKFTHIPGYETTVPVPVIRRNVVPTEGRTDMYDIHLELSGSPGTGGPGGGDPGPFPHQPTVCSTPVLVNDVSFTRSNLPNQSFGWTATANNVLLIILYGRNSGATTLAPPLGGYSQLAYNRTNNPGSFNDSIVVFGKIADGTETDWTPDNTGPDTWPSSSGGNAYISEWSGIDLNNVSWDSNVNNTGTTIMTAESLVSVGGGLIMGLFAQAGDANRTFTPAGGWTVADDFDNGQHPVDTTVYQTATAATITPVVTSNSGAGWRTLTILFQCVPSQSPPGTRVPVRNEFVAMGDGTTVTFTTNFPFADGSLEVFYDAIDQTPQIVSYDGSTGSFTMTGAPIPGQQVFVNYIGR